MMNMAAVDRRLAEEASRQNLVSHKLDAYSLYDLAAGSWEYHPNNNNYCEMSAHMSVFICGDIIQQKIDNHYSQYL